MNNQFEDLCRIREDRIDNVPAWVWLKSDDGAWDGPKQDWITSHKEKYTKYCKKFDVVVQAGGNQGMYPRLLSDIFSYVYTYEPDPINFYVLNRNCQKENIFKTQAALGAEPANIVISRTTMQNVGMHQVATLDGAIPMLSLDSLAFPTIDLLQLDVEGYEYNILQGAVRTINRHRPVISCENGHADLNAFLESHDYMIADQSISDTIYIPR